MVSELTVALQHFLGPLLKAISQLQVIKNGLVRGTMMNLFAAEPTDTSRLDSQQHSR